MNDGYNSTMRAFVLGGLIFFIVGGLIFYEGNNSNVKGYTLLKNQTPDWYFLQSKEYYESQQTQYFELKELLIKQHCKDGGFVEYTKERQFVVVCYEPKKMLE